MEILQIQALIDLIEENKELYADSFIDEINAALSRPVGDSMRMHLEALKTSVANNKLGWVEEKLNILRNQIAELLNNGDINNQ
jgi:hypothetical protein